MRQKHSKLNEDWSVLRNPSPYKIGPAPGYVADNRPEMSRQFFLRRAEEENMYNVKLQSIGSLMGLEPEFLALFKKVSEVANIVDSQKTLPLLTSQQKKTLDAIIDKLSNINKILTQDILADLDSLTVDFEDIKKEYSRGEV